MSELAGSALQQVIAYHDRTKHHLNRYARALGYMDWQSQPNPFRRYDGAPQIALQHFDKTESAADFDASVMMNIGLPAPLSAALVAQVLYDALAISAWKVAGSNRWAVRCNPSSGNLHPTEAYLLLPAIEGIDASPALYHYGVFGHVLEQRCVLDHTLWTQAMESLPAHSFLMTLSSIHWREAWKYGERAYRYCQHDVGHAIAQIAYAAATLGWKVHVLWAASDNDIAVLSGITEQKGPEAEHPDVLLLFSPQCVTSEIVQRWAPPAALLDVMREQRLQGTANCLSSTHYPWPVIEDVATAAYRKNGHSFILPNELPVFPELPSRALSARSLYRTRRSAVDMDGQTDMSLEAFVRLVARLQPGSWVPWSTLASTTTIHPVIFVHRVRDLAPGIYLLVRNPQCEPTLRVALSRFPTWEPVPELPASLPLWCLGKGDVRDFSRISNCHQDIASNGVFSVAMLADFERTLDEEGASAYRHLFWEAGAMGQVLYLEAEAAGLSGTGIGCFFDDVIHEVLGIEGHSFQSLYGFTVGCAVDDPRIQTEPA